MEDVRKASPAADVSSRRTAEQDSLFEEDESDDDGDDDEVLPKLVVAPVEEAARALQSAISFEATFGEIQEGESGDAEIAGAESVDAEGVELKSGDADKSTASLSATSEKQEQDIVATSQSSRPEHVAELPELVTNTDCCNPDSEQSKIDLLRTVSESLASAARAVEPTKSADVPFSPTGCSSNTTCRLLAGTARAAKSTKNTDAPSSQTILRSLIRGAHREMMYFTLPHERFSLDDLRQGLDYAFSMLQAAQSKLAILEVLHDDMPDLDAVQLRCWMARIDHLDSRNRHEPRMFVMFESLSSGEIRVALAEVVQSRLIVEDETKRTKSLLTRRLTELESNANSSALLGAWVDSVRTLLNESVGTANGLLGEEEAELDAVFTAVMAVMVIGFCLCVRAPE